MIWILFYFFHHFQTELTPDAGVGVFQNGRHSQFGIHSVFQRKLSAVSSNQQFPITIFFFFFKYKLQKVIYEFIHSLSLKIESLNYLLLNLISFKKFIKLFNMKWIKLLNNKFKNFITLNYTIKCLIHLFDEIKKMNKII